MQVEELLEQERAAAAAAAANTPPASRAAINTLRTQLQDTQDAKSQLEAKILKMEEAAQARADEHAALLEYLTLERQAEADERDEAERRLQHAQQAAVQWEDLARQYDTDRTAVAENVAKAEREVDLLAEENTALFRQINYLRSKLVANMAALDHAVPVVGRLARDLSAWCEKEGVARGGAGVGGSLGAGLSASMAGGAIGKSSMLGAPGTTMKTPGSKSFSRTLPRSVMRRNH